MWLHGRLKDVFSDTFIFLGVVCGSEGVEGRCRDLRLTSAEGLGRAGERRVDVGTR